MRWKHERLFKGNKTDFPSGVGVENELATL